MQNIQGAGLSCWSSWAWLVSPAFAKEPEILMWDDMIPGGDVGGDPLAHSRDRRSGAFRKWTNDDAVRRPCRTYGTEPVLELDGKFVKLPGFIVPLDSDEGGRLDEFLLVPYFGACIHVPPPPPNQIVYVRLEKPHQIDDIWEPYWIIGTIKTEPYDSELASAVYQMTGERLEKYDY